MVVARLTWDLEAKICRLYRQGFSMNGIATSAGTSVTTVSNVLARNHIRRERLQHRRARFNHYDARDLVDEDILR